MIENRCGEVRPEVRGLALMGLSQEIRKVGLIRESECYGHRVEHKSRR